MLGFFHILGWLLAAILALLSIAIVVGGFIAAIDKIRAERAYAARAAAEPGHCHHCKEHHCQFCTAVTTASKESR
jgi:mannose/fructose/N-acetylgalactosamine-specific phosphotransferase system component IIC